MKKQIPHAAENAGFGMPILRGIGISNRNTPELKRGLSRVRSTATPVLIATLSTTRRRVVVPSDQGESRDLHFAIRRFVTSRNRKSQRQRPGQRQAHPSHNPRRMRHPEKRRSGEGSLSRATKGSRGICTSRFGVSSHGKARRHNAKCARLRSERRMRIHRYPSTIAPRTGSVGRRIGMQVRRARRHPQGARYRIGQEWRR